MKEVILRKKEAQVMCRNSIVENMNRCKGIKNKAKKAVLKSERESCKGTY